MFRTAVLTSLALTSFAAEPAFIRDCDQPNVPLPTARFASGDSTSALYIASGAGAKGKALHWEWPARHGGCMSAIWEDQPAIPGFAGGDLRAVATLAVRSARPGELGSVLIQLMDSKGQTLQWRRSAQELTAGAWTTLSYEIDGAHPPEIWGGDGSGKAVPPLALWAVIVDMHDDAPAGDVWVDDLAITPRH